MHLIPSDLYEQLTGRAFVPRDATTRMGVAAKLEDFGIPPVNGTPWVEIPGVYDLGQADEQLEAWARAALPEGLEPFEVLRQSTAFLTEWPGHQGLTPGTWNAWSPKGWQPVDCYPPGTTGIIDFETSTLDGAPDGCWYPVLGLLVSAAGIWVWLSDLEALPRTVPSSPGCHLVAHNAGYDRKYLAGEYYPETSSRWLDTMGCYIAARGMSNQMRVAWEAGGKATAWGKTTSPASLDAIHQFYTGETLDKGPRELIEKRRLAAYRECLPEILRYCYLDCLATWRVLRYVLPEFQDTCPSLVSQTAAVLLGNTWLPLSERWREYYPRAEATYRQQLSEFETLLRGLALEQGDLQGCNNHVITRGPNTGLRQWQVEGNKKGWTLGQRPAPLLLGVTYGGDPVHWEDTGNAKTSHWATAKGPIPHPKGEPRLTQLFTATCKELWKSGALSMTGPQDLVQKAFSLLTWRAMRERIYSAYTVECSDGLALLPESCPTGTATRRSADSAWAVAPNAKPGRCGTEQKSMVEARPGYYLVGADVASQELWLSAVLGDSILGYTGATPLSASIHLGDKAQKTDVLSLLAATLGISRQACKAPTYGMIYGLGLGGLKTGLRCELGLLEEEAESLARRTLSAFRGDRGPGGHWVGGLASEAFRAIGAIADSRDQASPLLGAKAPAPFRACKGDFRTTLFNRVIQTSGVDYRDAMVCGLAALIKARGLDARLVFTIHDEYRYQVRESDVREFAVCMQLVHLTVRAAFIRALCLDCLPAGVAYFPEIDVDTVLRKEVTDPCITPSQPDPIPPGYVLRPEDLLCP